MDFSKHKTLAYVYHPDVKAVLVPQEEADRMVANGDWYDSPKKALESKKVKKPGRPKKVEDKKVEASGTDKSDDK